MANIILVDDREQSGKHTKESLEAEGHHVEWIQEERVGPCQDILWDALRARIWDILVLDIQLGAEVYGGIWVYNNSVQGGHRDRWKHTIVYTKHSGPNVRIATHPSHEFPIRVFVDTAGIPFENVVQSNVEGRQPLLDRISAIG